MKWRLYVCANCDEDAENPYRFIQPVPDDAHPDCSADMDNCPNCGGYLTFCEMGVGEIVVTMRTKGYGELRVNPEGKLY